MAFAKRALPALPALLSSVFLALALAGCSPAAHEVVDASQDCSSCHSEEKAVYDAPSQGFPGAQTVGASATVNASALSVVVCEPRFTSEEGSSFVPVRVAECKTAGGVANIEFPSDGPWVLCPDGDSSKAVLVVSEEGYNVDHAAVEL